MSAVGSRVDVPSNWYNIVADLPFELPPDIPPPGGADRATVKLQLPLALVRQSISRERHIPIPDEVRSLYASWRPTRLIRATRLEREIGTQSRIYYKWEGDNPSGSHKLCTALAQAYYYAKSGARRLTTGTGAGQWGTALAVACRYFGLECAVYMVAVSYHEKAHRKTIMELYGADVSPSPGPRTDPALLAGGEVEPGNMAFAVTEAMADALARDGSQLAVGSGEAYSLLHSTVIGIEAREQLESLDDPPDVVVASLGAGSNFGGIAFPFLEGTLRGRSSVRCVSVEPAACPKLTRGVYRYDKTDGSGITALQLMYTLGHRFRTPGMHAGGLRYHACSKIVSALYHHKLVEAVAYGQHDVFRSAAAFARVEGIVPAPESAHAVHGAIEEARRADQQGTRKSILFCLSGHGLYDLAAYSDYLSGRMVSPEPTEEDLMATIRQLPEVNA
jgi:tryptophan synthase beta chain